MRIKILLLGMFLGLGLMSAQAKDSTYVARQVLGNNIKKVIIGDKNITQIEIMQGDSNCIFYYSKDKIKALPQLCKIEKDQLNVNSEKDMEGVVKLVLRNNIELLEISDGSKVMVTGNFAFKSKESKIKLDGFANMKFDNNLIANIITLDLKSFSTIAADSVDIDSLILDLEDYTTVLIDEGHIRKVLNIDKVGRFSKVKISTEECQYSVSSSPNEEEAVKTLKTIGEKVINWADKRSKGGYWCTEFTFGFGAFNWTDDYFAMGATSENYQLAYGTAYILELKKRYTFRGNWFMVDFGIGYESDVINFDEGIKYDKGNFIVNTNVDGITDVHSKMVARYVTLPIMFNIKMKSLFVGVGVIGGLNYNNSRTGVETEYLSVNPENGYTTEVFYNSSYPYFYPYKVDFRAVFGFDSFHLFFQTSLTQFSDVKQLYPYRIGMMISL